MVFSLLSRLSPVRTCGLASGHRYSATPASGGSHADPATAVNPQNHQDPFY